jgi:hypothetical protein
VSDKPKRERLNLRIPADLLRWVKKYLRSKNRTVTQEVIDHFTRLRDIDADK